MRIICKTNKEVTNDEINILYDMYNFSTKRIPGSNKYAYNIDDEEYKKEWIEKRKSDPSYRFLIGIENGYLVGMIVMRLLEDENYIEEFHLLDHFKHDGKTFREFVIKAFEIGQVDCNFTGRIWDSNYEAADIFRKMGAHIIDKKYTFEYPRLKQWINNVDDSNENKNSIRSNKPETNSDSSELFKKHDEEFQKRKEERRKQNREN